MVQFLGGLALGSVVIFIRLPAKMQRVLGVVALLVGLGTICGAAGAETKVDALRVSISVFSGRPDPVFLITDPKLIGEVITMATSFPIDKAFSGESVIPNLLGYRGVVIDNVSTRNPDIEGILAEPTGDDPMPVFARMLPSGD